MKDKLALLISLTLTIPNNLFIIQISLALNL